MAAGPLHAVGRLAVERAKVRLPGLVPDSVEVVELTRGRPYVVVRTMPPGVVVLDERGRLVRGRGRLAAVARHVDLVGRVRATLDEARLERRREHVEHGIVLLERQRRLCGDTAVERGIAAVLERLEAFRDHLDNVRRELDRQRTLPPTERTLRRTIVLLNEAAGVDRGVVDAVRRLASDVVRSEVAAGARGPGTALRRWLVVRLASSDLPFFYAELHERDGVRFVEAFVASARA